jgi:hypothetical protein
MSDGGHQAALRSRPLAPLSSGHGDRRQRRAACGVGQQRAVDDVGEASFEVSGHAGGLQDPNFALHERCRDHRTATRHAAAGAGRRSSSAPPRITWPETVHTSSQPEATTRQPWPTRPRTRPTASRTGRRRSGVPPRPIGGPPGRGQRQTRPRSPPRPDPREPWPTATNGHQAWEQNVDNISRPAMPCSQFAPTTAHNRRIVDHQKIHYSRPVPALNCGYSSEADGVTRVELRGFEPLTL